MVQKGPLGLAREKYAVGKLFNALASAAGKMPL
jgi:hypothetical protein